MKHRKNTHIDMHVHTAGSDGFGTPEEYLAAIRKARLDGIALTDHHNTYTFESNDIAKFLTAEGVLVIRGGEYSSAQGHLLVYGAALEDLQLGYYADAQTVIQRAHDEGGIVVAAHPYHGYKRRMGDDIYTLAGLSAVESRNGNCEAVPNRDARERATAAAKALGLPTFGGSDAHRAADVGRTWTQIGRRCSTEAEVIDAIRAGLCQGRTNSRRLAVERRERRDWLRRISTQHPKWGAGDTFWTW